MIDLKTGKNYKEDLAWCNVNGDPQGRICLKQMNFSEFSEQLANCVNILNSVQVNTSQVLGTGSYSCRSVVRSPIPTFKDRRATVLQLRKLKTLRLQDEIFYKEIEFYIGKKMIKTVVLASERSKETYWITNKTTN